MESRGSITLGIFNKYPINKLIAVFVTVKMTFFIVVYFKDHIHF